MKKQVVSLIVSFIVAWWAASASAAEVTLNWNASNFAAVYSDLNQSGYKVFRSFDDGITWDLVAAEVDHMAERVKLTGQQWPA